MGHDSAQRPSSVTGKSVYDRYTLGALMLAYSLLRTRTPHDLVAMVCRAYVLVSSTARHSTTVSGRSGRSAAADSSATFL